MPVTTFQLRIEDTFDPTQAMPYRRRYTVQSVVGVPAELFVIDGVTDKFSHVATQIDLQAYPTNALEASTSGVMFYRVSAIDAEFESLAIAEEHYQAVTARLRSLARATEQLPAEYGGLRIVDFDGSAAA